MTPTDTACNTCLLAHPSPANEAKSAIVMADREKQAEKDIMRMLRRTEYCAKAIQPNFENFIVGRRSISATIGGKNYLLIDFSHYVGPEQVSRQAWGDIRTTLVHQLKTLKN